MSSPVATTPTVHPPASSAPSCAAASMPIARPLTTVMPARAAERGDLARVGDSHRRRGAGADDRDAWRVERVGAVALAEQHPRHPGVERRVEQVGVADREVVARRVPSDGFGGSPQVLSEVHGAVDVGRRDLGPVVQVGDGACDSPDACRAPAGQHARLAPAVPGARSRRARAPRSARARRRGRGRCDATACRCSRARCRSTAAATRAAASAEDSPRLVPAARISSRMSKRSSSGADNLRAYRARCTSLQRHCSDVRPHGHGLAHATSKKDGRKRRRSGRAADPHDALLERLPQ